MTSDDGLRWLLRLNAFLLLCAFPAIFFSYEVMNEIHQWLGMGDLPRAPIVGYLTRSISALYGICGIATWILSLDTTRYRTLINFWGIASVLFGSFLLWLDSREGMPFIWQIAEGPYLIPFGLAILTLNQRARKFD